MKRKIFRHNLKIQRLKYTNPNFEMPTIKIVDFTSTQVELFYLQKWSGEWNRIYCVVTSICVFRFVNTLLLRRNSEIKKMSSDFEWNSFANLARSSDEDIMEEDVESLTQTDVTC